MNPYTLSGTFAWPSTHLPSLMWSRTRSFFEGTVVQRTLSYFVASISTFRRRLQSHLRRICDARRQRSFTRRSNWSGNYGTTQGSLHVGGGRSFSNGTPQKGNSAPRSSARTSNASGVGADFKPETPHPIRLIGGAMSVHSITYKSPSTTGGTTTSADT